MNNLFDDTNQNNNNEVMPEVLIEAVNRIDSENSDTDDWQDRWNQGGNWHLEWSKSY